MTENISRSSESLWQSNSACLDASQSYGAESTALDLKVVGRGYLGTLISRALSVSPPVSLSSKTPVEGYNQTVVIASGPSSVSVTETELQSWREHLRHWLGAHRHQLATSKIIYLSSAGTVYGETGREEVDENCALNPKNHYGNYHCWAENELRNFCGDEVTILRLSNLYGPNQLNKKGQGLVTACIRSVRENDYLPIFGDGSLIRDYLLEDDLVLILKMLLDRPTAGTFNVASGIPYSIIEVIREVERLVNQSIKIKELPKRPEDIECIRLSNRKLLRALNINTLTNLRDGIKAYGYS